MTAPPPAKYSNRRIGNGPYRRRRKIPSSAGHRRKSGFGIPWRKSNNLRLPEEKRTAKKKKNGGYIGGYMASA